MDISDFGIFVVTPANLRSRWLNFEAGAIAKHLDHSRVIPLLFGIGTSELTGPLAGFQSLEWSQSAAIKLMVAINEQAQVRPDPEAVSKAVRLLWAGLDEEVSSLPGPLSDRAPLRYLLGDRDRGEPISLVFPRFIVEPELVAETSPEIADALHRLLEDDYFSKVFGKPGQREGGQGVDDVRPFAMNDLRALCTVARRVGREGGRSEPVPDEDVRPDDNQVPLVLFGLTTNSVAKDYMESSKLTGGKPLFEEITLNNGQPAVRLVNGTVYTYEGDNYGLIARVTPQNQDTTSKWLICAGLGPTGTEAAANYLNLKARSLAKSVGTQDFVKVVRCTKGRPSSFDSLPTDTVFADGSSPVG